MSLENNLRTLQLAALQERIYGSLKQELDNPPKTFNLRRSHGKPVNLGTAITPERDLRNRVSLFPPLTDDQIDTVFAYASKVKQLRTERGKTFTSVQEKLALDVLRGDNVFNTEDTMDMLFFGAERIEDVIVHAFMPAVLGIAKKFSLPGEQLYGVQLDSNFLDDFQNGIIGLIVAIGSFDQLRGNKFLTYAQHYIYGSIKNERRVKKGTPSVIDDLDQPLDYEDEKFTIADTLTTPGTTTMDAWLDLFMIKALMRNPEFLTDRQYAVLRLRLGGYTTADIANYLKVSMTTIDNENDVINGKIALITSA